MAVQGNTSEESGFGSFPKSVFRFKLRKVEQGGENVNNYPEEMQKSKQMPKHKHVKALSNKMGKNESTKTKTM